MDCEKWRVWVGGKICLGWGSQRMGIWWEKKLSSKKDSEQPESNRWPFDFRIRIRIPNYSQTLYQLSYARIWHLTRKLLPWTTDYYDTKKYFFFFLYTHIYCTCNHSLAIFLLLKLILTSHSLLYGHSKAPFFDHYIITSRDSNHIFEPFPVPSQSWDFLFGFSHRFLWVARVAPWSPFPTTLLLKYSFWGLIFFASCDAMSMMKNMYNDENDVF